MSDQGWVKLYRQLLDNPIFSSEKGLKVWIWCLLKASHRGYEIFVGREKVIVSEGQFVFGRDAAGRELKMSPSTAWSWMLRLNSDSYIDIKKTAKYSLVTIKSWKKFQDVDRSSDNKRTTDEQQIDTNKKDNKVKIYLYLEDQNFFSVYNSFLEMRKKMRRPLTGKGEELILAKLHKHPVEEAIKMLENSIENGWLGVFPLKDEKQTPKQKQNFDQEYKLPDGARAKKHYGVWVDSKDKNVKIDEGYFKSKYGKTVEELAEPIL